MPKDDLGDDVQGHPCEELVDLDLDGAAPALGLEGGEQLPGLPIEALVHSLEGPVVERRVDQAPLGGVQFAFHEDQALADDVVEGLKDAQA